MVLTLLIPKTKTQYTFAVRGAPLALGLLCLLMVLLKWSAKVRGALLAWLLWSALLW